MSTKLPFYLRGEVVRGFGRGSTQLGFPTANMTPSCFENHLSSDADAGVFCGFSRLPNEEIQFMVMSVGTNPTFGNTGTTVEVHVLKSYAEEFYGQEIEIYVVGHIRPMLKFDSLDALIAAINDDISQARKGLPAFDLQSIKNIMDTNKLKH